MNTIPWDLVATIVVSVFGSGGLWRFLDHRSERKSIQTKLLIGIAHDRIWYLCGHYIERGGVTQSEFDNIEAIVTPYLKSGGNGTGKKLWLDLKKLPTITESAAREADAKLVLEQTQRIKQETGGEIR